MKSLGTIRLLALDVDGVLTDGGLYYGPDGVMQRFDSRDGAGIVELRRRDFPVALVSFRDFPATRRRAGDLDIKLLCLGCSEKASALRKLCELLSIDSSEVLFMGDGLLDLPAIRIAGIGACPADAHSSVKAECDIVTSNDGGEGAVREIIDMLLESLNNV
ncbi:MAG: HAD hydrolase family protein [Candidatus Aegiribacteria sp.]|nr:HAD hydrolase family protein [Candidatus Aegiribacteria sp.]